MSLDSYFREENNIGYNPQNNLKELTQIFYNANGLHSLEESLDA